MTSGGRDRSADEARNRRKSDRQSDTNAPRLRVLAVDDDPAYLNYLRFVLSRAGFEVITANDGQAAFDLVREDPSIDLMLVDLAMPLMNGIETVRKIQEEIHDRGLYTILLTAHDAHDTKLHALDSGFDDFLTKLSSESEIVAKLRSAARRIELERRLTDAKDTFEALALTDELTGIPNRRALSRAAQAILGAGRDLSVVLFDLDSFKEVNDNFGHLAGDRILTDVAAALKENTRYGDVIARYGGDEFVLLLPDTGMEEARHIAERILIRIGQLKWTIRDVPVSVTATYGLSSTTAGAGTLYDLLGSCDDQLYRGKSRGRAERKPQAML